MGSWQVGDCSRLPTSGPCLSKEQAWQVPGPLQCVLGATGHEGPWPRPVACREQAGQKDHRKGWSRCSAECEG